MSQFSAVPIITGWAAVSGKKAPSRQWLGLWLCAVPSQYQLLRSSMMRLAASMSGCACELVRFLVLWKAVT